MMPDSNPQHDSYAGVMDMRGITVHQSFIIEQLQEPADFLNGLVEPRQEWGTEAHIVDDACHLGFMALSQLPLCTEFQQPKTQVKSCRAKRSMSGELGAKTLQAAWRQKTVKLSTPLQRLEQQPSAVKAGSAIVSPQRLGSCIAALWEGEAAGMFGEGLRGAESLGVPASPREGLHACMQHQGYDLALADSFFPAPADEDGMQDGMQDHIFSDCFRADLAQDAAKIIMHTSPALSSVLGKPQEQTSTSSDDEFCAMLFEHAPSLTSSEASLALCPSEHDAAPLERCSASGKRLIDAPYQPRSQAQRSKAICLDLGLERSQYMYRVKEEMPSADSQARPSQALQQSAMASGRKAQPGNGVRSGAGAAAAAAAGGCAARGKPGLKAETQQRGGDTCRAVQAKRRLPQALAVKCHRLQRAGAEVERPAGPSPATPFAAVQALLEWQALSHRVVTAAASPNQALAWTMLADDELSHFLAKMGKANITSAARAKPDVSRRECLIHSIKLIIGSARTTKAADSC